MLGDVLDFDDRSDFRVPNEAMVWVFELVQALK